LTNHPTVAGIEPTKRKVKSKNQKELRMNLKTILISLMAVLALAACDSPPENAA
jgi:hypothetical protein